MRSVKTWREKKNTNDKVTPEIVMQMDLEYWKIRFSYERRLHGGWTTLALGKLACFKKNCSYEWEREYTK